MSADPGRPRRLHWGALSAAAGVSAVGAALVLLLPPAAQATAIGEADHSPSQSTASPSDGPIGDFVHGEEAPSGEGPGRDKKDPSSKDPDKDVPLPPPPAAPATLPIEVDPLPGYQGQYICSPTPKPGSEKLAALIRATYVDSSDIWIPRDCSEGGRSEHKEGRALDWMISQRIPEQNAQAESFLNWLLATDDNGNQFAMARRLGVMYIGWGSEIWESYTGRWSELKGCYSTPGSDYDTYCHRDHIHISLSWDGAAAQTSFWGGDPTPAPFCPASRTPSPTPMEPGAGLDYLPVAPERILDTRTGEGIHGQPCRLAARSSGGPGTPVVLDIANRKGVPQGGVRAVALRVSTVGSNSPATLRTSVTGNLDSVDVNVRREVVTILPLASDGTVALTTDSGATHVVADLVGYFVTPEAAAATGGRLLAHANEVVYDSAQLQLPLQAGEKRVIDVGKASTSDGPPAGALLTVTATNANQMGQLVLRRTGDKRTVATPVLPYRRKDTVTTTFLAALDAEGRITVVNTGRGPVDVILAVQASAVRTPELGSLLIPVTPATVRAKPTTLGAVLGEDEKAADARPVGLAEPKFASVVEGAVAAVLQVRVTAAKKGGSVVFWSMGEPSTPSMVVPRQSSISGLVIVPLDAKGTLRRTVTGSLDVDARVVAYLR
ncbi:MAG: hypothetical protein B7C55_03765 [Actinomycetales bacterium mxb001]|nr:MAG: hypothetical protein B7C55_03765 [Actinomycetales bacterium mxb001]